MGGRHGESTPGDSGRRCDRAPGGCCAESAWQLCSRHRFGHSGTEWGIVMRMKSEHADRLQEVLRLSDLTLRSRLILTRRYIRHLNTECARAEGKGGSIKPSQTIPAKRRHIALLEFGSWLDQNDKLLTELYGFDGICDLLGVNSVHRIIVVACAGSVDRAISAVALMAGYEESASRQSGRHPADWKDGPLYQALWWNLKQAYRRSLSSRH